MRTALDRLYNAAGVLAALFLIGTLAMVLVGIAGRMFNFHVPGTDSYAGYCMAASGFLALASTFRSGGHIRVTLIIERLSGGARHGLEPKIFNLSEFLKSGAALSCLIMRLNRRKPEGDK